MKKQLQSSAHQDYLDILEKTLRTETYSILDAEKINKIMFRVKSNLGLIEDMSKLKRTTTIKVAKKNHTSLWFFISVGFLFMIFKVVAENYAYLYKLHY